MKEQYRLKLRSFFLRELPNFFYNRLCEIIDRNKISKHIQESQQRYKMYIKDTDRGFCRSISVCVSMCLKAYGFDAEPRDIRLMLGNRHARLTLDKYGFDGLNKTLREDDRIYTIGCGFTQYSDDFHTIVTIDNEYLLDMTIDAMRRPKKGIIINNYFCTFEELINRYKSIILYEVLPHEINKNCAILDHPKVLNIFNYVMEQISVRLNIPKKIFKNIIDDSSREQISRFFRKDFNC